MVFVKSEGHANPKEELTLVKAPKKTGLLVLSGIAYIAVEENVKTDLNLETSFKQGLRLPFIPHPPLFATPVNGSGVEPS